jgi:predicted RNA-binding protein YlxR (DUF448 family)
MTEGYPIRHLPERTCIGCRSKSPASELVCLIAPEGKLCVAQRGRLHGRHEQTAGTLKRGRGAWVHSRCFTKALKNVGRAFRRPVEVSDQETLLAQVHSASGRSINAQGDLR